MGLIEYALLTAGSLFAILNAVAAVPAFLALTPTADLKARERMARVACFVSMCVMYLFGLLGGYIFKIFGISMPAFQTAGGLLLVLVALDMLRAHQSDYKGGQEELAQGAVKQDIAVTPLAIPMLSGPGAISTVIVLSDKAHTLPHQLILYACIPVVCFLSYLTLYLGARGARSLNSMSMNIITRLMGLLLAAIGMEFIGQALPQLLHLR